MILSFFSLILALAQLPVGSTAQVTMLSSNGQTYIYTGILVRSNELAPCTAASNAQDVKLTGKYTIVSWPRPCPRLPLTISPAAVQKYLAGKVTLLSAYQSPS